MRVIICFHVNHFLLELCDDVILLNNGRNSSFFDLIQLFNELLISSFELLILRHEFGDFLFLLLLLFDLVENFIFFFLDGFIKFVENLFHLLFFVSIFYGILVLLLKVVSFSSFKFKVTFYLSDIDFYLIDDFFLLMLQVR